MPRRGKQQIKQQLKQLKQMKFWRFDTVRTSRCNRFFWMISEISDSKVKSIRVSLGVKQGQPKPCILKSISTIRMNYLTQISLCNCRISSVQTISLIEAPAVQLLQLQFNFITTIRSLRKAHFPDLQHLNLDGNQILDLQTLSQANFKNLCSLTLEHCQDMANSIQDIGILTKLQTDNLQELEIMGQERINRTVINKSLSRRFTGAFIDTNSAVESLADSDSE